MSGAIHKIKGFGLQWCFDNKIKITDPEGKVLWTNSIKIVRERIINYKYK